MVAGDSTDERLVEFVYGEADERTAALIRSGLADSAPLRKALDEVRRVIATLETDGSRDPPAWVLERAAAMVRGELVYDGRGPAAPAGFRGAGAPYQLMYSSAMGAVELSISARRRDRSAPGPAAAHPAGWLIHGQLNGAQRHPQATVALVRGGTDEVVARTRTDERGYFSLPAEPGSYEVLIALPSRTLRLGEFSLGGD